jgi:myo-inositol-1-phosphate synthase
VWDSPNSAGIVIDAVRCCKLALNHGVGGQLDGPSSYLMKSPQNQRPDDQARADTEKFIAKYSRRPIAGRTPSGVGRSAGVKRGARSAGTAKAPKRTVAPATARAPKAPAAK